MKSANDNQRLKKVMKQMSEMRIKRREMKLSLKEMTI